MMTKQRAITTRNAAARDIVVMFLSSSVLWCRIRTLIFVSEPTELVSLLCVLVRNINAANFLH